MKQILINASQKEEVRLAVVENNSLLDLDIDLPSKNIKSNIYKGTISRVEPSLEAAFVNYGRARHGFLPFKEISPDIFIPGKPKSARDCIEPGKEVVVQVDREERGTKGAALSTYLSLAGKYLVLLPKNPNTGGISRRLEGNDRVTAKKLLDDINVPDNMSVILRTSGLNSSKESLEWDMNYLIQIFESILESSVLKKAPYLIYEESSMLARLVRDYADDTIDEIVIDNEKFYNDFLNAKEHFIPHSKIKIEHYTKTVPIFSNFGIETQVQTVYKRKVTLPSGGNIVFDTTEALTSIDVNSAKSTKGGDIEETALNTNLEAAISLATQLRLRDVGGLIVVDFIDMIAINSQKSVMRKMAELSKIDKAKIQFSRISKFGLMEISRQKLKSSLIDTNSELCHTCSGTGNIKSLTTLSVSLARILEEEAMKNKKPLTVYLPVRLATYLLNEKKDLIRSIEERQSISIKVVPDPDTEGSSYHIDREGLSADAFKATLKNKSVIKNSNLSNPKYQEASVKAVTPKTLPPKPSNGNKKSFVKKIGFFRSIINKIKSIFGIKPKRQYKGKQHYSRRRFNNKNNYSKYNKYKSFNKKKNYYPKNNASNKQNTANSAKSANSD
jgi:ribonuclease E